MCAPCYASIWVSLITRLEHEMEWLNGIWKWIGLTTIVALAGWNWGNNPNGGMELGGSILMVGWSKGTLI